MMIIVIMTIILMIIITKINKNNKNSNNNNNDIINNNKSIAKILIIIKILTIVIIITIIITIIIIIIWMKIRKVIILQLFLKKYTCHARLIGSLIVRNVLMMTTVFSCVVVCYNLFICLYNILVVCLRTCIFKPVSILRPDRFKYFFLIRDHFN